MLSPFPLAGKPTQISPTTFGKGGFNFICLTGTVNLFRFFAPPQPGSVVGTLNTIIGSVPLIQTGPSLSGVPTLSSVDQQLATVCGSLTLAGNQLALDVRFVLPGACHVAPRVDPPTSPFMSGSDPIGKGFGKGFGKKPFLKGGFGKKFFKKPFHKHKGGFHKKHHPRHPWTGGTETEM